MLIASCIIIIGTSITLWPAASVTLKQSLGCADEVVVAAAHQHYIDHVERKRCGVDPDHPRDARNHAPATVGPPA